MPVEELVDFLTSHNIEILKSRSLMTEGTIMAVKILIQRKVKPGKEKELNETVKELRSMAIHAQGYISGAASDSTTTEAGSSVDC